MVKILAQTTADKVFQKLRHTIVEGEIPAGSKLNEVELATRFMVSRAVIREAISRLEALRLIERTPNVGARVVPLSLPRLAELYEIRETLEGMAARLAALYMDAHEIQSLKKLLSQHALQIGNGAKYYQEDGDVDFHYRILQGSKNKLLIDLLMDGIYHITRMYRVQLGMAGPRVTTAFNEHLRIVEAIESHDTELAEILMRRHIAFTRKEIENKLKETK
ncbi:MAG: putative D-xylose utilization operon transcriptional repressor [Turneriella sp.]|nr:putative D-xylose utilization operon transcriptional repressor [Turneriella sp.]